MLKKLIIGLTVGVSFSSAASALTIDVVDSGWYEPVRGHISSNTNYAVGPNDSYRNFFIFDLSSVAGQVTSATLKLETDPTWVQGTPNYEMYDVSTDLTTLVTDHTAGAATDAIHADLGSGVFYGSGTVNNIDNMFEFTLNAAALSDINAAAGGLWALGGRNSLMDGSYAFWNTGSEIGNYTRQLILETSSTAVAAPASLLLMGAGLIGVSLRRRV